MEDQSPPRMQPLAQGVLKDELFASDDLTLKKYHRKDRNLIITGIPRSGTSLLSVIINGFDNAVCLNEIFYDVVSLPKAFSLARKKLIAGETVPNKFNESGDLTTDTQISSVIIKEEVVPNVDENVLIGSKVNIPYLNQLPVLLAYGYKTICLVRDPVYTIGSWCSSKASGIPEAKVADEDMHPRWRHFNFRTKDRIERMIQIWNHYAQLIWNYRFKLKILTYENLVLEYKREMENLARDLEIRNFPTNLDLKNGNNRLKYPEIEDIIKKVNLLCPIKHKFKYEDHDTKLSVSFQKRSSKRKIAFFAGDGDNFHFIQPVIDRLKTFEFETRIVKSKGLSQEDLCKHMKWSDVSWFEWANGPIIAASRMPKKCKIICRLHRYEVYSDAPKKINWESVDRLIFVSPVILEVFKEFHYKDIDKRTSVQIIPNALDLNNFQFNQRKKGFNIAYITRINSDKNPALMVQIISELTRRDSRFKCYMIGQIQDVAQFQYLGHLIEKLSLQNHIIYDGICNDVDKWLNDKHFILSTSIIESQGLGIMEGMAKGLKPVIHNFFGKPNLIFDRKYVFDTIQQAVEMFLSNDYHPREYRNLIERRYSLDEQVENIRKILLADNPRPSPRIPFSNRPFISIVIPTFNRDAYIKEAIESALDQKDSNFEVLVFDDGSNDNTKKVIENLKSKKLRYIYKKHSGTPDTRNRAIKEAKGDFIIWLGSDDILMPNAVTDYINAIYRYPDVDVFYGDLIIMDRFKNYIRELKYPDFYKQNAFLLNRFLFGCALPDGGSLINKHLYHKFGGYSLDFSRAHDYEFWTKVVDKITVKHIGRFVYRWRWHESNMSSGSVDFDTSYDVKIKKNILKSHSLKKLFPYLNWNEEKKSLETAYFAIGNSFNQLKSYKDAIAYYEKCLAINKSENYYCALGLAYFQLEDLNKSVWAFNEAVKINPENEKAKEISENLNKILWAKNKRHQVSSTAVGINKDRNHPAKKIDPLVSVIVPTYNRPQMLTNAVKSILSQSYQNFEIVVVNDGGADVSETLDQIDDHKIKYIQHSKNKGLAAARNTGIRHASGQCIALLDDDDIFYSDHLEIAVKNLSKKNPVIYTDAVRATYERCGDNYNLIKKYVPYSIDFDRNKLLIANLSPVNCFVFDKNLAFKAGLFDETLSTLEDWDFWIRLSSLTSFRHINKPTVQVNWRNDGTTMTSLRGDEFAENRERIYHRYHNEIAQIPNKREIFEEFQKIWAKDWQVKSQLTSIIILTRNQLEYTKKCIESIFQNTQKPYELIIVDNGSIDGTVKYLESEILGRHESAEIKIIKNIENKGFAAGNNQGIAAAAGDYILLMNNDVVVTPGWLERLIHCAVRHPQIGIVGPRSNYVSGMQLVKDVNYDLNTLDGLSDFSNQFADQYDGQAQQSLRVVGFCMLIKRGLIGKIGGFDDRYGLGNFEDDDFSLRATIAGFESWIAMDCFVHHFGHRTFVGEKIDLSKSLLKNWKIFKEKWGLPVDMPYGSPYRLSDMKNTHFDPLIHYHSLAKNKMSVEQPASDFQAAKSAYAEIQRHISTKPSEQIIEELEQFVALYPDFALAYNDLGVLYYQIGNNEKAVRHYERATELMPENITLQKNLADFYCIEYGWIEKALKIYVDILKTHPQDVETLLASGRICAALEKPDDASEFFKNVLKIEPWNEDARHHLQTLVKYREGHNLSTSESPDTALILKDNSEVKHLESDRYADGNPANTVSIIVSLEGLQNRVKECVKRIQVHASEPHEIVFVKDKATKGMLKWVQKLIKDNPNYRLFDSAEFAGWAESRNQAINAAGGDFIVLLHNDVLVSEGWLSALKACINCSSGIGLAGPMSNKTSGPQQIMISDDCRDDNFDSDSQKFYVHNQFRRMPTIELSGFCLIFKRDVIEKIGSFDEQFSSEELVIKDFCNRTAAWGYQNLVAADVYVYHYDHHKAQKSLPTRDITYAEDKERYSEKWNGNGGRGLQTQAFRTARLLVKADELKQKGQIDAAIETLLNAIGIQPANARLYLALAEILLAANQFKDAIDALNEMPDVEKQNPARTGMDTTGLQAEPSAGGFGGTGVQNLKIKKLELMGYAEEGLANYDAARDYVDRVLLVDPNAALVLNLKGILAYRNDDRNAAEQFFNKAIASDPGYGEPYTNLGTLKLEADEVQDALKLFEKSFILTPFDFDIATNYHAVISERGDFAGAEVIAREAASLYPNNRKISYMLIDFLVQQGKYDKAISEIEAAIVKFGVEDGILSAAQRIRDKIGPMRISKSRKHNAVSLCMIVKNEEKYLAKCLASVKPIVDEMIVVDTGSTDKTKEIANVFGAKVFDYEWNEDFAAARNFSISKADGGWIFIMDGDEVISSVDYQKFNELVKYLPKFPVAYSIVTRNYSSLANIVGWVPNDGKYAEEEAAIGWMPSVKVRLFHGKDQIWFEGAVHEMVDPVLKRAGIQIKPCSIAIHHYGRLDRKKVNCKGELYFEIGKKKLEEMGNDVNAIRELAVQATTLEKNQKAIELWQELLSLKPIPSMAAEACINMATIYNRTARFEAALSAAKRAMEYAPEMKEAIYNYALAELHVGNAEKTITVLEELLKQVPDYPPARFILTAAYCCRGQKEKGFEGLRKLKQTPLNPVLVLSFLELAKGLISAQRIEYAVLLLGAAIEIEEVNEELLNLFAECVRMKSEIKSSNHEHGYHPGRQYADVSYQPLGK